MSRPTGRLVYMDQPEKLEMREFEVEEPEPGGLLTEIVRANVCGSELHIWQGKHPEVKNGALGHEALCRVLETGDGVETDYAGQPIAEGDIIAPVYYITCQSCPACLDGEFHLCENAYQYWSLSPEDPPHFHGTFATHYYIHPKQYFFKIPDGLDHGIAAGANCALSQVLFGLDRVELGYGETLLVQGAGGLGLNAIAVANERGAETIVVEGVDQRIERAKAFGADHVIDLTEQETVAARRERVQELTGGVGADVAAELTGVPEAFAEGIHLLREGGRYLEMGNVSPGLTTEFDPGLLTRKSIEITSLVRYQPWYLQKALDFLDAHADAYPYDDLIDAEFGLDEVTTALEKSESRDVTRATLVPDLE